MTSTDTPKITAVFKRFPEDFRVEEIPAYEPSGHGQHVFLTVEKRMNSTSWVARQIADRLQVLTRDVGHAGMKDRNAVTVQRLSVPCPTDRPIEELLQLQGQGWRVLDARRHDNKLRVGHLRGNRFEIVLRDLDARDAEGAARHLEQAAEKGFPNAFGPQRFGRDGDNPNRALAWLRGEARAPKDRRERALLFSSVQSMLFDQVLRRRVEQGTWDTVLRGDLAKTHDRGGLFECEDESEDAARAARKEISATGPMFGPKMRWPGGMPGQIEAEVLEQFLGTRQLPRWLSKIGAGTRRILRVLPEELRIELREDDQYPGKTALVVSFVLPKGAYATTFLLQAFDLKQPS